MLTVFYSDINTAFQVNSYESGLAMMPEVIKNRIEKFYHQDDRKLSLMGKLLLCKQLHYHGLAEKLPLQLLHEDEYGRPYFHSEFDFNISHSGKYAICTASKNCRVGTDIEEVRKINFSDFTDFFSNNEWNLIHNANDPLTSFYKLWSRKEALVKADGTGIRILHEIEAIDDTVSIGNREFAIKALQVDDQYQASIAYTGSVQKILVEKISFNFRGVSGNYNAYVNISEF